VILAALDPTGVIMTVIGLGALIFFHELGHFVACRLTNTRVEVFSIGFGPKVFGWRRGKTLYKVAAIPLGGYVKMAAENPGDERTGAPDEFPNKSFGQRLFIMANGVVFNVLLAVVFYIVAFGIGVSFPRAELGKVHRGAAGWEAGLRAGDVITHVNGRAILGFDDVFTEVAFSGAGETLLLTVQRDGDAIDLRVTPVYSEEAGFPAIGALAVFDPVMKGVAEGSPLEKAGGREGDTVLSLDGRPVKRVVDIGSIVQRAAERAPAGSRAVAFEVEVRRSGGEVETLEVEVPLAGFDDEKPQLGIVPYTGNVVRRVATGAPAAGLLLPGDRILRIDGQQMEDLRLLEDSDSPEAPVGSIEVEREGEPLSLTPPAPLTQRQLTDSVVGGGNLKSTRVSPRPGMPALRAGLQAGDRLVRVGSTRVTSWSDISEAVEENGLKPVAVTVERNGEALDLTIEPVGRPKYNLLGYLAAPDRLIHEEGNILCAIETGWDRTVMSVKAVVLTIRGLITRRVHVRNIGGPITLAQATYTMLELGWGRFLYILALISVNLAILNILPIPVLDGGQIVLLCAEKLRGKPLPERVVGYLQLAGLVLILGLLVLAFHNDIVRVFG
jgi:regulator of sigma E protease